MRRIILGGLLLVGLGGGALLLLGPSATRADSPAPAAKSAPAVPVSSGRATAETVAIMRNGLGTVQGFNTVTVRTRVDGEIQNIAYTEGQDVNAGDLLVQIDPRSLQAQLTQAEAQKAKDEAQLADARRQFDRFSALAQRDFATRQSVDSQMALVHQLEASIKGDGAAIENARTQLSYTTITAPIGGRVGFRLVDKGNLVRATDATGLVVITQIHPISVVFTLPESLLPAINRARAAGPVAVEAWSQDDKEQLDNGSLTLIDNQIDQTTGSIKLKATMPNQTGNLWPGQFVTVHLVLEQRGNAVTVPSQTVQRSQEGTFVWIIKPDDTVEMRPVTAGQIAKGLAVIDKGLAAGERVVVEGQYKLRPGIKISESNPKAAGATPVASTAETPK